MGSAQSRRKTRPAGRDRPAPLPCAGSLWMHRAGTLGYEANTVQGAEAAAVTHAARRQRLAEAILQERQTMAARRKAESTEQGS